MKVENLEKHLNEQTLRDLKRFTCRAKKNILLEFNAFGTSRMTPSSYGPFHLVVWSRDMNYCLYDDRFPYFE